MNTIEKLNMLAEFQAERDALQLKKQELIDSVLTPEIKAQLADIEAEFAPEAKEIEENIAHITEVIKPEVIAAGGTVKGAYLQAVYSRGRVSWDTKALDGYAAGHPEILQFRKEGEPIVSIRANK